MLLQNKRVPIEKGAVYTKCTVCADHGGRMEVEGNCQESGQGYGEERDGNLSNKSYFVHVWNCYCEPFL